MRLQRGRGGEERRGEERGRRGTGTEKERKGVGEVE